MFDKKLPEARKWQIYAYLFSKWYGWRVSDFSATSRPVSLKGASGAAKMANYEGFIYRSGSDHSYILLGGQGDDKLIGGYEDDILIGGPGADEFTGFDGADIFVVGDNDIIWDFNPDEGDILYLGHLTEPDPDTRPDAYLRAEIQPRTSDMDAYTILRIDSDGSGSGYSDASISLRDVVIQDTDLNLLGVDGGLHIGGFSPSLISEIEKEALADDHFDTSFTDTRNYHSADYDITDYRISLPELMRVIQLYNASGYHCDSDGEDGYGVGPGDTDCGVHSADFSNPRDWRIDLPELMRVIQLYNADGYHEDIRGEDGFWPGKER